ncbi:MAG: Maf family protein [Gemmatimonadota bacterium]
MNPPPPPHPHPRLILASQSPRRAELLRMLGFRFDVVPADIDETYTRGETGPAHAERLAREKAEAIARAHADAIVIGSDTVVLIDDHVLGKPTSEEHAIEMLLGLQGRVHQVATGIAVAAPGHRLAGGVEIVDVTFRAFDRRKAEQYVATGEPMDKAGAYGIQGFGAALVECVRGDYFAVMGLPLQRMIAMLERLGWNYDFTGISNEA